MTRLARGVVVVIVVKRLARWADRRQQPGQGQAGRILRRGRNDHGQGEDDGDDGTGDT
jgi:hypothetical protein